MAALERRKDTRTLTDDQRGVVGACAFLRFTFLEKLRSGSKFRGYASFSGRCPREDIAPTKYGRHRSTIVVPNGRNSWSRESHPVAEAFPATQPTVGSYLCRALVFRLTTRRRQTTRAHCPLLILPHQERTDRGVPWLCVQ